MRLPNGQRAVVDIRKLRDYCLSPDHPRGRHKARLFAAVLGLGATNAAWLRKRILRAAAQGDARATDTDAYGQRYVLDFVCEGPKGRADVRTCWIVRRDEDFPRLTSCFLP